MRKALFVLLPFVFGLLLTGTASAQRTLVFATPTPIPSPSPSPSPRATPVVARPCPQVNVIHQGGPQIRDGQPVTFTVNVVGGDPKVQATMLWSVSSGFISRGENTRTIVVDSTGAGNTPDRELKAEVWVGGYAPECVLQSSSVVKVIAPALKFGEFGVVPDETLKDNLKQLTNFLSQSPDNLWVIVYTGRKSERGFAQSWAKKIKDGLIANSVEPRRVTVVDGGYREEPLFDFWTVPGGAIPPRPAPTIDRREIMTPRITPVKKPSP